MFTRLKRIHKTFELTVIATAVLVSAPTQSAVIAADGGITLWVSYDNLDVAGATLSDTITEANQLPGGFGCSVTNTGRSDVGAASSPPSCPGGAGSCTAEEKVSGDIEKLADYIAESTEGAHYLRRVYLSDQGRAWDNADIKWNTGNGGSSAPLGWSVPGSSMSLNSAYRTCIHDVLHHELGHYLYHLPDRYSSSTGYYQGTMPGSSSQFQVNVTQRDVNTVMSNNFPHRFVDTTNASITVDYTPPGPGSVVGEVLTPGLLTDGDPTNDGPNRAHHSFTFPFATDEWSLLPDVHADLAGVHTEGNFASASSVPAVDIVVIGDETPHPGTALVLDRSGSMSVTTNGVTAAQFVQEAGMFLYHSSEDDELVGTYLYNGSVEELFEYETYDASNDLPYASFRTATGSTDIAGALEAAIDALIDEHTEGGVNGAEIYLMSDGRQTTGSSLWDEVDRANNLGIRINTFSFGNADTTTMNDIAGGSGGEPITMSERNDAAELKMLMTRKFSTGRGLTPIHTYKGRIGERINLGSNQLSYGQFNVPPKSRSLQFYTFLHTGDASQDLILQLISPSGVTYDSPTPNLVAEKGRFNGIKVDEAEPGLWTYLLASQQGSSLPSEPIELAVYADNRELKGRTWVDSIASNGQAVVKATLNFRYPLSDIDVKTTLYSFGERIAELPMFDNGTNGDEVADDGVYAMTLNLNADQLGKILQNSERKPEKLRVETEFTVTKNSIPATRAHYETGFDAEMAAKDYAVANQSEFKVWATTLINLAETRGDQPDRKPRIDNGPDDDSNDDPEKSPIGTIGKLQFILTNARPTLSNMRVSLGQGVVARVVDVEDVSVEEKEPVRTFGSLTTPTSFKSAATITSLKAPKFNKLSTLSRFHTHIHHDSLKIHQPHTNVLTHSIANTVPVLKVPAPKDTENEQRTRYTVKYEVSSDAQTGPRDLKVQFGSTVFEKHDALVVY